MISRYNYKISLTAFITVILTMTLPAANIPILFQQEQVLAQISADCKTEGQRLLKQGTQQLSSGQIGNARESWQQALTIFREIKQRNYESVVLLLLGMTYVYQNNYTTAIDYYQQALKIVQQLPKRNNEREILVQLGDAYRALRKYSQAIEYYQQALAIARQIKDSENEKIALTKLADAYLDLEDYAKVIDISRQGLKLLNGNQDRSFAIEFLQNIGGAYYYLADYGKAIYYAQKSLEIARIIKDQRKESHALNLIGNIYYFLPDYDKAIDYYQQNLAIARSLKNRLQEGQALGNIGLAYNAKGEAGKAIDYLQQDLVIEREFKDRLGESQTLQYLGIAYQQLRNYSKAIEYYQQSVAIAREVKYTRGESISLTNLGVTFWEFGKLPEAEKSLSEAIELWESLRAKLGNNDSYKISIFEQQDRTYRFLQQVLIAQNKINEALEISERGRARAFVELLTNRLSRNTQRGITQVSSAKVDKPTLPLLQTIAKQQNATLVEYSILTLLSQKGKQETIDSSELYIWVIKPTGEVGFRKVDLKSLQEKDNTTLEKLVTISRESIGARGRGGGILVGQNPDAPKAKQKLQQLHKLLIAPIADLLPKQETEKVIFIPQESLFLVPFPALLDEQGKYLIEKHTILTAPSIQVLDLTHKQRHPGTASLQNALVVGNPTMPSVPPAPGEKPQQLPNLPGAEKEAQAIASLLNTKAITGKQATKAAILEKISQAEIIHLATHGLLDDYRGLGSALAFAPDAQGKNGLLTAQEILDMKLQADLVVLSACDTGRGKITGDGVIGLSRALISAGVPSVVVSLWSIPDAPTAELMGEFYKNFQQRKLDKATALRQAMLTTMKTHPSPGDWAAFTLIGESE